ncbi:glycosyltransferase family 2 protein, partial [Candidatus Micrarchaeota archaeon]|nr:glycosyltransferase family 2 protein [Candidatus Micrarchaeota archaeon]
RLGTLKGEGIMLHDWGNWVLSAATSVLFGMRITDMETGYKVFRREVVEGMQLRSNKFDIEPEITAKIIKRGYKIHEVPIDFSPRGFAEGKKITVFDGLVALWTLVKYRLLP